MQANPDVLTYLAEATETKAGQRPPSVGDTVEFRLLRGGAEIEAWSDAGLRLGRVPPAERAALAGLLAEAPLPLRGRIAALVPRPRQAGTGRIHIRVASR
jgi:hypothetical protein